MWVVVEAGGGKGVSRSLPSCLFGHKKAMCKPPWAQHGNKGVGERGRQKKWEGSKGFTARSRTSQVMDMLELVQSKPAAFLSFWRGRGERKQPGCNLPHALKGIYGKLIFQHLWAKHELSGVYSDMRGAAVCVRICVGRDVDAYHGRLLLPHSREAALRRPVTVG